MKKSAGSKAVHWVAYSVGSLAVRLAECSERKTAELSVHEWVQQSAALTVDLRVALLVPQWAETKVVSMESCSAENWAAHSAG